MIHSMKFLLKKCQNNKMSDRFFYYSKKLGTGIGLLLCLSFLSFFLLETQSTHLAETVLRANEIVPTAENTREVTQELSLDQPFIIRYIRWLQQASHGDFGTSFITKEKVSVSIAQAFILTLLLTGLVFLLLLLFSFSIGVYSVIKQGSISEKILRLTLFFIGSLPSYWIGILFIVFFSLQLQFFPTSGVDEAGAIVLPTLTLVCANLPSYVRIVRQELIQTMQKTFMQYYYLRNFSSRRIFYHLLKNSIRASLTSMSMGFPKLIAGSAVVESIFSWPGMGMLCVRAISTRDIPLLQGYIVFVAFFFMLFNMLIQQLNQKIDPRLEGTGNQ
ncbi:ABC transporter permease [Enterococcus ratti]|nr:ABC transporter permease [Enterococcus ratti]